MANARAVSHKVKAYLEALSPEACSMLLRGLEAGKHRSDADPQYAIILNAARALARGDESDVPRKNLLRRVFFNPASAFLGSDPLPPKQKSVIARSSLDAIWTWFERDVLPSAFEPALSTLEQVDEIDEKILAELATALRNEVTPVAHQHITDIWQSPEGRQRLAAQLGGERVLEDLVDLLEVFERREHLDGLQNSLPAVLDVANLDDDGSPIAAVQRFIAAHPDDATWAAVMVATRALTPRVIPVMVVKLAGSDKIKNIWNSPFKSFIDVFMHELERQIEVYRHLAISRGEISELAQCIQRYHDFMRALEVEIDLDAANPWQERMTELVRHMSAAISDQIKQTPGDIRRALRLANGYAEAAGGPDTHAMADAERGLRQLKAARDAVDDLAINELVSNCWRTCEQTLEILTANAIDSLKTATGEECAAWGDIVDCGICLSEIMFGEDYAVLLRRSRHNAVNASKAESA